jgi:hypothetical protein
MGAVETLRFVVAVVVDGVGVGVEVVDVMALVLL